MDFDLVANYDAKDIVNFLDYNPQLWDKEPNQNIHNAPNYKSINHQDNLDLDLLIDPIIEDLVSKVGGRVIQRSISLLPAHEDIREHSDVVNGLRRFHMAIKTNDDVIFYCGNSQINMKVGQCWEFDYKKLHKVLNDGSSPRIHLLVDLSKDKL